MRAKLPTTSVFRTTTYLGILFLVTGMALRSTRAQTPPPSVPSIATGRIEEHLAPNSPRQKIVVNPPHMWFDERGEMLVEPNVSVVEAAAYDPSTDADGEQIPHDGSRLSVPLSGPLLAPPEGADLDVLPGLAGDHSVLAPEYLPNPSEAIAEPVFDHMLGDCCHAESAAWPMGIGCCGPLGRLLRWRQYGLADVGLGHEHVMNALFEIDNTQPMNNVRLRFDAAYGIPFPDRAEYYWAKTPGPRRPGLPEVSMDYQEMRMMLEVGGKRFSTQTEIPIRAIDPVRNGNTAGMGDMSVTTKTLLVDGGTWQLTQIFRTYMMTGSASHGTGTGHMSMEPGLLCRYKWNDRLYMHSEIKYWFPLGGDLVHSGQVLRYGMGFSSIWLESDAFALMPTCEIVGWSVLDGQETQPNGVPRDVDGYHIFNIFPGLRCVFDNQSDLGLWEVGINGGLSLTNQQWYEALLRVELRILM